MHTENDNINWERINKYSKLPPEELDRMLEEEEAEVRKQIAALNQK